MAHHDDPSQLLEDRSAGLRAPGGAAAQGGNGALQVGSGPYLRYLNGHDALPMASLTCPVVPAACNANTRELVVG